jgi:hypothetical protein
MQTGPKKKKKKKTWGLVSIWYVSAISLSNHKYKSFNPFVTSGTYMSHLQTVFSSLQGYQYPMSSPCCHLPWTISTLWNQSEWIFPRNSRIQMLVCAMLRGWLSVVMYFLSTLSVFQWDKRGRCFYIVCVVIYNASIRELSFVLGNTFQVMCYCVSVTSVVFQYLCLRLTDCIWGLFLELRVVSLSCTCLLCLPSCRLLILVFFCDIVSSRYGMLERERFSSMSVFSLCCG